MFHLKLSSTMLLLQNISDVIKNLKNLNSYGHDILVKGEFSGFFLKENIMNENDVLSEYNKIPLGDNRTNGAVYFKIFFKVEICSAL